MKLVKCQVCGLVLAEDELHEHCPKCNAPKEKFDVLSDEDAAKIERSEFTNGLHLELIKLCREIEDLATSGIEDALDPACVKVFKKAKADAFMIRRMCKAELAGHVSKGKW